MSGQEQGSQESRNWRCECTYLHGQRQHGQAKTGIRPVRQAVWADRESVHRSLFFREWPPSTSKGKTGAGGGRDRPLLLPPFTRVQRYIGRGLKTGRQGKATLHCYDSKYTHYCQVSNVARVECKDEKPGRPSTLTYCTAVIHYIARTYMDYIPHPHTHTRPYTCM